MGSILHRWDVQFYLVLLALVLFVLAGASLLGTDYAIGGFLGASIVSLNFAVLIILGRYFFKWPKRKIAPVILLIGHVFIVPGSLYSLIRFADINTVAILSGALISATVSPFAMAVIGLFHATSANRLSYAIVHRRSNEEDR